MKTMLKAIRTEPSLAEYQRLQLRIEYAKMVVTALALFIPLMVLAATVLASYWLAQARERVDFELKAAEIVMNASSPSAATNKAAVLMELFPGKLSPAFASTLGGLYDSAQSSVGQK